MFKYQHVPRKMGMDRSLICSQLSLEGIKPEDRPLAIAIYQYKWGKRFYHWKIIGRARMFPVNTADGSTKMKAMSPCLCSCGVQRWVSTPKMREGLSRSCGHANSIHPLRKAVNVIKDIFK